MHLFWGEKRFERCGRTDLRPRKRSLCPPIPPVPTGVQQTLKANAGYSPAKQAPEQPAAFPPDTEAPRPEPSYEETSPEQSRSARPRPSAAGDSLHCPPGLPAKPAPKSLFPAFLGGAAETGGAGLFLSVRSQFFFLQGGTGSCKTGTAQPAQEDVPALRYIGEVFPTYLLLEAGDKFIVMDKHAAHERIRYEQLRSQLSLDCAQALVHPIPLTLTADQQALLEEHRARLAEYGLRFGKTQEGFCLTAAPSVLEHSQLSLLVEEMLSSIAARKQDISPAAWERLLETTACRGAIKGGEENSREELQRLALQVWKDPTIRHCPHDGPLRWCSPRRQLEKRFGRTGSQALLGEEEPFGG